MFTEEHLREDGIQWLIIVIMDAAVDSVESFDRQEESVFQIEASHENRLVFPRRAHQTCSHTVVK